MKPLLKIKSSQITFQGHSCLQYGSNRSGSLRQRKVCNAGRFVLQRQNWIKSRLYSKGLSGDLFFGRIVDVIEIEEHTAIIPEPKGRAFITGINQLIIDKEDPLKYGFSVQ